MRELLGCVQHLVVARCNAGAYSLLSGRRLLRSPPTTHLAHPAPLSRAHALFCLGVHSPGRIIRPIVPHTLLAPLAAGSLFRNFTHLTDTPVRSSSFSTETRHPSRRCCCCFSAALLGLRYIRCVLLRRISCYCCEFTAECTLDSELFFCSCLPFIGRSIL